MEKQELNNRRLGALAGMNSYDDAFKMEKQIIKDTAEFNYNLGYSKAIEDVNKMIDELKHKLEVSKTCKNANKLVIDGQMHTLEYLKQKITGEKE